MWLALLFLFLYQAESIIGTQSNHQVFQQFITDAALELAIEPINSHLLQRVAVDVVNSPEQFSRFKEGVFQRIGVLFESLIGAVARAGRTPKLTTNHLIFFGDIFNAALYQLVLIGRPFNSRYV